MTMVHTLGERRSLQSLNIAYAIRYDIKQYKIIEYDYACAYMHTRTSVTVTSLCNIGIPRKIIKSFQFWYVENILSDILESMWFNFIYTANDRATIIPGLSVWINNFT